MFLVEERTVYCPHCGQPAEILVDAETWPTQDIAEDCPVCGRGLDCHVEVDRAGDVRVEVHAS